MEHKPRDLQLLDILDKLQRESLESDVWRIVRKQRDVLQPAQVGARWNPPTLEVLYTSFERSGALSEIHHHLSLQPVFPSKVESVLWRLNVKVTRAARLDFTILESLGVNRDEYAARQYTRTQQIGEAAAFLGFDSIIVPSARWNCSNLVLFTQQIEPENLTSLESEDIDWGAWRKSTKA